MKIVSRIWSFIQSKKTNARWLKLLLVLSVILLFLWWKRRSTVYSEGFTQNERYAMKRDDETYDTFYTGIYDYLNQTNSRSKYEMENIITVTQPDKQNSVFLDIGCGTGCIVNELTEQGFRAFGVDKSRAMVDVSNHKYPAAQVRCGNVEDSMEFSRETFTHILCLNKTIYEIPDKVAFFRNCYHWLVPGGYLIVHLVNPQKFDPIVPAGKPRILDNPQKYAKERITDTVIDFIDFKYKSAYDFADVDQKGIIRHTETFTDKQTGNIRENERTITCESEKTILGIARMCQFVGYGQFSMKEFNGDEYQTVYIFQKI
jgi:SAM-dependent methyltransferase